MSDVPGIAAEVIELVPSPRPRVSASRFSADTQALLESLGRIFVGFTDRQLHVRSTHAELTRVTLGKPFRVHHTTMWRMAHSERDMVIVQAASWVKRFYEKGGFLTELAGELDAVALRWDGQEDASPERRAAFERLFPSAGTVPEKRHVHVLGNRLQNAFKPLVQDRNEYRAHPFDGAKTGTAKLLEPVEVGHYLARIHRLLADLHLLSACNHFSSWDSSPDAGADARDIVDLVLCGPLGWIVDQVDARLRREPGAEARYVQRREAHYARLHAAHDAKSAPHKPFNDNAVELP